MRRTLILLTIAGGVLAAGLAAPYGLLAACLAYLVGGTALAALGLWYFTREKRTTAPDTSEVRRPGYESSRAS